MTQGVGGPQQPQYETYVQSWSPDTMAALRAMNINANTTIDISFASFHFTWPQGPNGPAQMGGMQMPAQDLKALVDYVHSRGGHVKIAFGGANPAYYLSNAMNPSGLSPGAVAGAIASVVKQYGLDGVDLDIEDKPFPPYPGFAASASQMIKDLSWNLEQQGSKATISLTLEGQAWLPGSYVPELIKNSQQYVSHINFMEYNIWINPIGQGPGKPNSYAQQIQSDINYYHQNWGVDPSKIMLGLMPGRDEYDPPNNLTLDAAKQLATWAQQTGLAGVMTWSLNLDYEGRDGNASGAYTKAIESILNISAAPRSGSEFDVTSMTPKRRRSGPTPHKGPPPETIDPAKNLKPKPKGLFDIDKGS
jgi:chitinase